MIIRKFNESQDDFEIGKKELMIKINEVLDIYNDFVDDVSPKHWRRTGHHITELNKMLDEISTLTAITKEESEIDWVKDSRFKN